MATSDRRVTNDWRRIPEVGSVLGIRFLAFLALSFGRTVVGLFLWVVAAYYAVASRRARIASRDFLARIGESTGQRHVVRHLYTFARASIDRLFFLRGRTGAFEIERHGDHHLAALARRGQGAILLGSHLGSFEAMRAAGKSEGLRLSIVVDRASAERVARLLHELAPDAAIGVIAMDDDAVSTALRIKTAIADGQLVGMLGDRRATDPARNVSVDFLGARAQLPIGPYLVAHALRCPVYQVFGLLTGPARYDLSCEPFADRVDLPRAAREDAIRNYAQRYADTLAEYTRRAPFNWFNFYDFWAP
jgi:predicted LPLAT superfamily acyltransferase